MKKTILVLAACALLAGALSAAPAIDLAVSAGIRIGSLTETKRTTVLSAWTQDAENALSNSSWLGISVGTSHFQATLASFGQDDKGGSTTTTSSLSSSSATTTRTWDNRSRSFVSIECLAKYPLRLGGLRV